MILEESLSRSAGGGLRDVRESAERAVATCVMYAAARRALGRGEVRVRRSVRADPFHLALAGLAIRAFR